MTRPTKTELSALRHMNSERDLARTSLSLAATYEAEGNLAAAASAAHQAGVHLDAAHAAKYSADAARRREETKKRFGK